MQDRTCVPRYPVTKKSKASMHSACDVSMSVGQDYLATCANPRIARPECFISSAQPSISCNVNKSIIMPYLRRNPTVFFRVQDEYSQAQYCEHRGILSKNQSYASFDPRLSKTRQTIQDHLDWASRKSSAFISVYSD